LLPRLTAHTRTGTRLVQASIVLILSVWYCSNVFRISEGAFLTTGLGDWLDPYFINFLLEHWHHSLWTLTDPSSPPMYFPAGGTLGYSHGLILYAPFYVAGRLFLDPIQAYTVTLFLVLQTGAVCMYLILRNFARLGFVESLLLSAFFFSSGNLINGGTGVWSQRASVFLVPPILLIALGSARMADGRSRVALAALSGLLSTLIFTQDFYTGAFAVLLAALLLLPRAASTLIERGDPGRVSRRPNPWWLIVACVSLVSATAIHVHPIARTTIGPLRFSATDPNRLLVLGLLTGGWFVWRQADLARRISNGWKSDRLYILGFTAGGFVGCLVFLWIYAAVYLEHRAFPEADLINALTPVDFSRLGWTRLGAHETLRSLTFESLRSFRFVLMVAILAWLPWFRLERRLRLYCLWFLLVSFIVLMIPLRFDGFSIWRSFVAPLPGFSVIRDPRRIIEVYELAVVLLAALLLTHLPGNSRLRVSVSALVFLLLVTERNRNVFDFARPIGVHARWITAPIAIDSSCRSFFIERASGAYLSRPMHQPSVAALDAMFIALDRSIPTLNGYSAWAPGQWGMTDPQEPGYAEDVARWIALQNLRNVCTLDIEARTMRPYVPAGAER
jgi:hypothetical protein